MIKRVESNINNSIIFITKKLRLNNLEVLKMLELIKL
jgi:hypothetical protein